MARLIITCGHQKDMCHNEIKLHARNAYTILGLIVNIFGSTYVITKQERKPSFQPHGTFCIL